MTQPNQIDDTAWLHKSTSKINQQIYGDIPGDVGLVTRNCRHEFSDPIYQHNLKTRSGDMGMPSRIWRHNAADVDLIHGAGNPNLATLTCHD